jgi:hypothetical protein
MSFARGLVVESESERVIFFQFLQQCKEVGTVIYVSICVYAKLKYELMRNYQ